MSLDGIIKQLRGALPQGTIRWVRVEGIHLTLAFLGNVSPERIEPIQASIRAVSQSCNSFVCHVSGFGCFPNLKRPRTLWVGVQDREHRLGKIQSDVADAMQDHGFARESRPFHPHLTLGRVKKNVRGREAEGLAQSLATVQVGSLGEIVVDAIHLIRSDLRPTGAEYTTLYSAPFGVGA